MTASDQSFPKWFWLVLTLALLWFLMDLSAFLMRTLFLETMLEPIPEQQQQLYRSMPIWVTVVFGLEVFGGAIGCVLMILKKAVALRFFQVSLFGVLAQTVYVYFLSDAVAVMGTTAVVMPLVAIAIVIGMVLLALTARKRGWID